MSQGVAMEEYAARDSRGDWKGFYSADDQPELRLRQASGPPPFDGVLRELHYTRTLLERTGFQGGCAESSCQHALSLANIVYAFPDDMGLKPVGANELGGLSALRVRREADTTGSSTVVEWVDGWGDAYCELRVRKNASGHLDEVERTYFMPGRRDVPLFGYLYSVRSYTEGPAELGERFCPAPGTAVLDERPSEPVSYEIGESCEVPSIEKLQQAIDEAGARGVNCDLE